MDISKSDLFRTVKSLHEKGAVTLTASEQELIDRETKDLLANAATVRTAMKAPEGFDKLLEELKMTQNPDEAFDAVVQFMDSKGDLEEKPMDKPMDIDMPGGEIEDMGGKPKLDLKPDMGMDDNPDMGMGDKPDMGMDLKPDMGMDDKPDMGMGDLPGKDDKEDKKPGKDDKDDKEDKKPGKDDKDDKEDKKPGKDDKEDKGDKNPEMDLKKEKIDIMARALILDRKAMSQSEEDLEELKEDDSEEGEMSAKAMGIKDSKTITVKVTAERNIMVLKNDKPLSFHRVASDVTDLELKRLANRILGLTIHEGPKSVIAKLGGTLVAGVDDDIELVVQEDIAPASEPVVADGDDVIKEEEESPASTVTEDAEFVTKETPKSAKEDKEDKKEDKEDKKEDKEEKKEDKEEKKAMEGVDEGIDIAVKDDMDNDVNAVTESDEDVIKDNKETPDNETQDGADVDFQSVEANMKALYSNRSTKEASAMNKTFIDKFIRAFKVASERMLLNHDEHQFKISAYDVLTSETDMEEEDAADVSEAIATSGHTAFVDQQLKRTADLMKKSDEYLKDAEADLKNQNVRVAEVNISKKSSKAQSLKKAAIAGNFGNVRTPAPSSINNDNGGLREVIGSTPMSRLATRLHELKG